MDTSRHPGGRRRGGKHECARASARVGARAKRDHRQRGVTAGVAGVETSRPSGLAPAIIVGGTYGNHSDLLGQTTSSGAAASSEMVLHMLDTLMTGHEPFYADYPSYQETDPLTHPHHQHHPHQHAIARNTGMPPVTLDATTHTPGTTATNSSLRGDFSFRSRYFSGRKVASVWGGWKVCGWLVWISMDFE